MFELHLKSLYKQLSTTSDIIELLIVKNVPYNTSYGYL